MAVKTLTIMEDAYEALKRQKHKDESFSEVIRRLSGQKLKVKDLIGVLKKTPEEHEEFARRVKEVRERMGKSMQERAQRVRARHINTN